MNHDHSDFRTFLKLMLATLILFGCLFVIMIAQSATVHVLETTDTLNQGRVKLNSNFVGLASSTTTNAPIAGPNITLTPTATGTVVSASSIITGGTNAFSPQFKVAALTNVYLADTVPVGAVLVTNAATVHGTLSASAAANVATLTATNAAQFRAGANVAGTVAASALIVTNAAAVSGTLSANGAANVAGALSASSVNVTNGLALRDADASATFTWLAPSVLPASITLETPTTNALAGQSWHADGSGGSYWATPAGSGMASNAIANSSGFGTNTFLTNFNLMSGSVTGQTFAVVGNAGQFFLINTNHLTTVGSILTFQRGLGATKTNVVSETLLGKISFHGMNTNPGAINGVLAAAIEARADSWFTNSTGGEASIRFLAGTATGGSLFEIGRFDDTGLNVTNHATIQSNLTVLGHVNVTSGITNTGSLKTVNADIGGTLYVNANIENTGVGNITGFNDIAAAQHLSALGNLTVGGHVNVTSGITNTGSLKTVNADIGGTLFVNSNIENTGLGNITGFTDIEAAQNLSAVGKLILLDADSTASFAWQAPAVMPGSYVLKPPTTNGLVGQTLRTDGDAPGNLYWATPEGISGVVTSSFAFSPQFTVVDTNVYLAATVPVGALLVTNAATVHGTLFASAAANVATLTATNAAQFQQGFTATIAAQFLAGFNAAGVVGVASLIATNTATFHNGLNVPGTVATSVLRVTNSASLRATVNASAAVNVATLIATNTANLHNGLNVAGTLSAADVNVTNGLALRDADASATFTWTAPAVIPASITLATPTTNALAGQSWHADGSGGSYWATSSGSGEANVNGEVSVTNSTRFGLVHSKAGVTNLLRSVSSSSSITIENQGTNLNFVLPPGIGLTNPVISSVSGQFDQDNLKIALRTGYVADALSIVGTNSPTEVFLIRSNAVVWNPAGIETKEIVWFTNATAFGTPVTVLDVGSNSLQTITLTGHTGLISTNRTARGGVVVKTFRFIASGGDWNVTNNSSWRQFGTNSWFTVPSGKSARLSVWNFDTTEAGMESDYQVQAN